MRSIAWIWPPGRGNRARRCPLPVKRLLARLWNLPASFIAHEGDTGNGFASYNIATDTWTPLASRSLCDGSLWLCIGRLQRQGVCGGWHHRISVTPVWIYDVASNTWSVGTAAPTGPFLLAGYQQVGQFLYVVGGFDPSAINLTTTSRLDMSSAPGVWDVGPVFTPQRADFGLAYDAGTNKLYALGGDLGNDGNFFNSTNLVDELDVSGWPGGTWTSSPPVLPSPNRQANQAGFFGNGEIWSVGGINGATFQFLSEVWHRNDGGCGGASPTPTGTPSATPTVTGTPSATPTGTPSPTPTCTAGGSPGPWTQAAPVGIDHYGGFMDSDGAFAYEGGGYSFSVGDNTNEFGKFDPVANAWTPLAPVPDLINAEASAVYAPNVNELFVFGGDSPNSGIVVNTTRIYDIATNTWSSGAPMPDVRAFMASGYFNGKIYLVGGYNTGNVDPSFGQVWEYDPVTNTFNTSRTSMPATLGGPGFGVINGHLYVAGGRDINNTNLSTLYDYDIAADAWTQRANLPSGINVPGSAVIGGKLWVFGGGNPFANGSGAAPVSAKKGLGAWLKRLFRPDTTNVMQVYDPVSDSWSNGPSLNLQRSFPAGTHVGNTAVAVGGYDGSNTITSVEINVTSGGCASPTPTATPSCTPGGTPGPWTIVANYPLVVESAAVTSDGMFGYSVGGFDRVCANRRLLPV